MHKLRMIATSVVVLGFWVAVLFQWCCSSAGPTLSPAASPPVLGASGSREDPGLRAEEAARSVSAEVERALIENGMETGKAAKLARDTGVIVRSMLAPDARPYLMLMESRGCKYAPFATDLLSHLHQNCYPTVTPSAWGRTNEEQFKYAWEHPSARGVEVASILPDTVECGARMLVTAGSPDWPGSTFIALNTVLQRPTGRPTQSTVRQFEKDGNTGWIQFMVRYSSGFESRVRIISYFDAEIGEWLPYAIAIEGIPGHVAYPLI